MKKKLTKKQRQKILTIYYAIKFFESMQKINKKEAENKFLDEIEEIIDEPNNQKHYEK